MYIYAYIYIYVFIERDSKKYVEDSFMFRSQRLLHGQDWLQSQGLIFFSVIQILVVPLTGESYIDLFRSKM